MSILYLYQHLPLYISPIAFTVGPFSVRWYGLSYLAGFITAYLVLLRRVGSDDPKSIAQIFSASWRISSSNRIQNTILDFLLVAFFSALIGGRIGYVLFYNLPYFLAHPWAIISPYGGGADTLIGIYGMSYHGALVGVIVASWIFVKIKKMDFLRWADFVSPAAALGYFFGRLGNFLNGELYGRVTNSPLGMYFLADQNVLRHPSQLYEAFLEGVLLFLVLWSMRKLDLPKGGLFAAYIVGYGILRIFAEQFRRPDPQIGFIFGFVTMGQILSLAMVFAGSLLFLVCRNNKSGNF